MEQKFELSDKYRNIWNRMETQVENDIRENRQEIFRFQIRDIDGRGIPSAVVKAVQKTHDFDFGCNCLWLGQRGKEDGIYERRLSELFNIVTTTFCLSDMQPEPGRWRFEDNTGEIFRRPPADRVIRFAKKHGLKLKGQPLLAGSWYPKWAGKMNQTDEEIKAMYADYFHRVAERYGDTFDMFDLVNEALCHTSFPLYTEQLEYVEWAFKTAYPMFPRRVKLSLNEATGWVFDEDAENGNNKYFNLIRRLLDNGTKIDTIGFQFHLWNPIRDLIRGEGRYTFDKIREQIQKFSVFGIPMYITEITIPSCIDGFRNEAAQAEILESFYRLFFSIPMMRGVLQWNLCDGRAWMGEGDFRGGIADEFLRKKPSYLALEHLLNREWKTAVELSADESGTLEFRGFRGDYDIIVEGAGLRRSYYNVRLERSESKQLTLV